MSRDWGDDTNGLKVALIPAATAAALEVEREHQREHKAKRHRHGD